MSLPRVVVPPSHSTPVTGRCHLFKKVWADTLQLSPWHLKALEAMPIDWTSSPECNRPFDSSSRYPADSKERLACTKTLEHYLKIGSVQELSPEVSDGLWSTFFPVPKKGTDKMRGCIDLRQPNSCIRYEHFKMEGLHTVQSLIRRNDLMTKIDLSDFYMHFLIGKADRKYMRFMWEGKKYECIGMPFGLAPAPRLATKIMAPVIRYLRSCGLRVSIYIDDLILMSRSYKESIAHTQLLVDTLHKLGFSIHPEKVQLIPSRSSEFLGTQVNSRKMQFRVPRDKIRSTRREIRAVFRENECGTLTVRKFCSLLGKLNSLSGAVVSAQLHLWPLHHLMRQQLMKATYKDLMYLDSPVVEEMQWWHDEMHQWSGKAIISARCQMVVTTDASGLGWGGWWRPFGHSGKLKDEARGFWLPTEEGMSSNARELSGVKLTIQAGLEHFRNRVVLVETDNKVTQAYINHLGGRSIFLNSIARDLWSMCYRAHILLVAVHRPGKVNVRADRLSRWKHDHTDIRLSKAAFEIVDRRYGPHSVDLFATRDNRLLPRYVSWHPDPSAVAVDAFLFPLKGENPYCFPPVTCIPRLLREVLRQQVTVTLIAPDWQAAWRPDLDRLLLDPPLRLPTDSIKSTDSTLPHSKLTCFRISGSYSRLSAARRASSTLF